MRYEVRVWLIFHIPWNLSKSFILLEYWIELINPSLRFTLLFVIEHDQSDKIIPFKEFLVWVLLCCSWAHCSISYEFKQTSIILDISLFMDSLIQIQIQIEFSQLILIMCCLLILFFWNGKWQIFSLSERTSFMWKKVIWLRSSTKYGTTQ
jgi:hypothetical protein